jgi:hypothetical protein
MISVFVVVVVKRGGVLLCRAHHRGLFAWKEFRLKELTALDPADDVLERLEFIDGLITTGAGLRFADAKPRDTCAIIRAALASASNSSASVTSSSIPRLGSNA